MDATAYLKSLGIAVHAPHVAAIGRLVIAGKFELGGSRGVVVRPKRGSVSDRYIEMLAAEGVSYVLVDGTSRLESYGKSEKMDGLVPIRALPISHPDRFPTAEIWAALVRLVRNAASGAGGALALGSGLFAAKLRDEASEGRRFGPALVAIDNRMPIAELVDSGVAGLPSNAQEAIRTAAAILAGFRITPSDGVEAATLLEQVALLGDTRQGLVGLPALLSPLFTGPWEEGRTVVVVSATLGGQWAILHGRTGGMAILPKPLQVAQSVLERALAGMRFFWGDFLTWRPHMSASLMVVVPPIGLQVNGTSLEGRFKLAAREGKPMSRVPVETLYVEHAIATAADGGLIVAVLPEGLLANVGYARFRSWVLERVRLLAVVSLPAGACFAGSGIKCSVVYLQKQVSLTADYPILMVEVSEDDLGSPEARATVQTRLAEFLHREVQPCA